MRWLEPTTSNVSMKVLGDGWSFTKVSGFFEEHREPGCVPCTRHEPTGTTKPSCSLCWLNAETRLARNEQLSWADDGGRVPELTMEMVYDGR